MTNALAVVQYHMTTSQSAAMLVRRTRSIIGRIVASVKSKAGCVGRVSTELIVSATSFSRVHVWAVAPCRIPMAAGGPSHSPLAPGIEFESNAEVARLLGRLY